MARQRIIQDVTNDRYFKECDRWKRDEYSSLYVRFENTKDNAAKYSMSSRDDEAITTVLDHLTVVFPTSNFRVIEIDR